MSRLSKFAAAAAAIVGASLAPAGAQTANNTLSSGGVMSLVSASDISALMSPFGVTTKLMPAQNGGMPFLLAQAPGGGMFIFHLLACQDATQAAGCQSAIVTAGLPSAGATYDDINAFNGNAAVTTAVNVAEQQIIVFGRHILVAGGHSRDLFAETVVLFLTDVQNYAARTAGAASISFKPEASKTGAAVDAPANIFGLSDISAEVSAAISNTREVSFTLKDKIEQ